MEIIIAPISKILKYTDALQNAINTCSLNNGGTVRITKGVYVIGTIFLKSNVRIFLDYGAVLKGSTDENDYPQNVHKQMYKNETHMDRCLFFANNCENIILEGYGVIDGNGGDMQAVRPMMFRYMHSKNIRIENICFRAPASWTNAFIGCEDIWVRGVDIFSRANGNGDGLDFDGCSNVIVSDCKFDCSDDCICLQNSFDDKSCDNVVVTNCVFKSRWAGLRIGLLSCGIIKNLTVSNCVFRNIDCSALKIQSAEGSIVENMTFTNLIMEDVVRPVFITANAFREHCEKVEQIKGPSTVRNMYFNNIISTNINEDFLKNKEQQPKCITLDCDQGHVIENINFANITMQLLGEKYDITHNIPTHEGKRAEGHNYNGLLPAFALFARNIKELSVEDLKVKVKGVETRQKIIKIDCE